MQAGAQSAEPHQPGKKSILLNKQDKEPVNILLINILLAVPANVFSTKEQGKEEENEGRKEGGKEGREEGRKEGREGGKVYYLERSKAVISR